MSFSEQNEQELSQFRSYPNPNAAVEPSLAEAQSDGDVIVSMARAQLFGRECDSWRNDGLTVSLLFDPASLTPTWILVDDARYPDDVSFFPVAPDRAADALAHPFRYIP